MPATIAMKRGAFGDVSAFPRLVDTLVLGSDTAESWTCPSGTRAILVSADNPVYMRCAGTAAVPSSDLTDGTGSLQIPATAVFEVEEGVAYSFIRLSGTATIVTIGRYSFP